MVLNKRRLIAALLAVTISSSAYGQEAAPAVPSTPTLWSFLGIPQGVKKVQGALTNRRGNLPRTEPKDALKALNDPANLESPDPAIKRAAEIKKAEDLKPQKIKAIKYLTSIGCGCYDKDGSVTKALIAAAEDCTEDVRLATMTEILEAAEGKCCSNCGQVCCCNDDMLKKLAQIAYERDEYGCYGEPSKRVREAAAEALAACCPGAVPLEVLAPEKEEPEPEPEPEPVPEKDVESGEPVPEAERSAEDPTDGPQAAAVQPPTGEPQRLPPAKAIENPANLIQPDASPSDASPPNLTLKFSDQLRLRQTYPIQRAQPRPMDAAQRMQLQQAAEPQATELRPTHPQAAQLTPASLQRAVPEGISRMRQLMAANPPLVSASPNPRGGVVLAYDPTTTTAYVHFEQADANVPVGSTLHMRPDPTVGSGFNGMWLVVESALGCANLVPLDSEGLHRVRVGDHANFGAPEIVVAPISFNR
jgi:hypothetical protein